jgi:hypothetical protein
MKKELLLSVVASTMIFAGGDIAPVEPAAPASADFWGQIGFYYQAEDIDAVWGSADFGDEGNNWFGATVVLGVEKELGYGFGFGAELAGWTNFDWDLGDRSGFFSNGVIALIFQDGTSAEVSQAYLTYTFGNTAIKAGRQALPKAVSPWAWSSRTGGVIDYSFDGIVIANTDLQDTTLVAAWVDQVNANQQFDNIDVSDSAGLFMLAMINKSLANTTLAMSAYYVPESNFNWQEDMWSIWASAVGSVDTINWGVQVAYVDGDAPAGWSLDATFGIAAKIGSAWGDFDAQLVAGYINDGDFSFKTAGAGIWGQGTASAFWTFNGDFGGDIVGDDVWSVRVDAGYKLPVGKVFGSLGYWDADAGAFFDNAFDFRIGYKFNVAGIDSKIEYRYLDLDNSLDDTRQRIRVEAYYKF